MPFNLGAGEVLVVLLVALLVLGPERLPQAARNMGRALTEVRRVTTGFQAELRDAMQEPVDGTPRQASNLRPPSTPGRRATPGRDTPADHSREGQVDDRHDDARADEGRGTAASDGGGGTATPDA